MLKKTDKKELDEALNKNSDVMGMIESLAAEYREKFELLGEKAQEGERGMKLGETASELEQVHEYLSEAVTCGETLLAV